MDRQWLSVAFEQAISMGRHLAAQSESETMASHYSFSAHWLEDAEKVCAHFSDASVAYLRTEYEFYKNPVAPWSSLLCALQKVGLSLEMGLRKSERPKEKKQ